MKKVLFASLALSMACSAAYGQAQRRALIEGFTQASCGPCASANPTYNALIHQAGNVPKVVSLKYQVSWPGYDPMYLQNTVDIDNRVAYYSVSGVPDMELDGDVLQNVAPGSITQSVIDNQYAVTSPIDLSLTHDWNATADSITITVTMDNTLGTADYNPAASLRLHVVIAEKQIDFATAPGSNGETTFYGVVRKMIPSAAGATFATIPMGQSLTVTYTVPVPGYIYNLNEVATAAFIQNNTGKHVDNAEWSDPMPLPAGLDLLDITASSQTVAPAGYCDYNVTPIVRVVNTNTTPLTSYKAYYSINGGTAVQQDVTGISVISGANNVATFPQITLPAGGAATLSYWVNSFNYNTAPAVDPNLSDNAIPDESFYTLSPAAVATTISENFTGLATGDLAPANAILKQSVADFALVLDGADANQTVLGAFGMDNITYFFDCYTAAAGETANLIFDKIDLSAYVGEPTLSLAHAYAQYSTENDKLEVKVSTDCGATWTTLFNKAGATLMTSPPVGNNTRFWPTAAQWTGDTISLAAYATETELVINFKATSDYGNAMFIDKINIADVVAIGTNTVAAANTSVSVFPNPVRNEMTVQFTVSETTDMNVVIYNALGQQVRNVASGSFNGMNQVTVNTSDLAAGVYNLNLVSKAGVTTQRFVVER